MKKFKTSTLVTVILYIIIVVTISSCGDVINFPNYQSTWVVTKVEHENKVMASYRVETTDTTDLNVSSTWLMDSIGKFGIGDTLVFSKKSYR
jgi:hypothetical protein